jgi:hypothetical protein
MNGKINGKLSGGIYRERTTNIKIHEKKETAPSTRVMRRNVRGNENKQLPSPL